MGCVVGEKSRGVLEGGREGLHGKRLRGVKKKFALYYWLSRNRRPSVSRVICGVWWVQCAAITYRLCGRETVELNAIIRAPSFLPQCPSADWPQGTFGGVETMHADYVNPHKPNNSTPPQFISAPVTVC